MNMRHLVLASAVLLLGPTAGAFAAEKSTSPARTVGGAKLYGNAERGEAIVGRWCVSCHKPGPAIDDRAPPFVTLATDAQKNEGVIRSFLMRPHDPMPPLKLTTQEIEDIVAYLRSLQPAAR